MTLPNALRTTVLGLAVLGVTAASGTEAGAGDAAVPVRAMSVQTPTRAADFALTTHTGRRARLSDYKGKVVLLYFGYTSCPGICPTTLAEVGQALRALGPQRAANVQPIIVSVDPERDTPAKLAEYVKHFHSSYLGMTGTVGEVLAAAAQYGIYVRRTEGPTPADYLLDHTSMVLVVDPEGFLRLLFPHGMTGKAMAEDLTRLLTGASAQTPRIEVDGAWTPTLPPVVKSAELYMVIRNAGSTPDRLTGARSSACGTVQVYESTHSGMSSHAGTGMMGMRPVLSPIDVTAGAQVDLKPGGLHLMCMNRTAGFEAGRTVPVTLTFERAGDVSVSVAVKGR
jgi:protein SCO1/2